MEIKDAEFAKEWFGEIRRCFETQDGQVRRVETLTRSRSWRRITSGVNSKTLEELYFLSTTVAYGQLQQSGAYPNNEDFNEVYLVTW